MVTDSRRVNGDGDGPVEGASDVGMGQAWSRDLPFSMACSLRGISLW